MPVTVWHGPRDRHPVQARGSGLAVRVGLLGITCVLFIRSLKVTETPLLRHIEGAWGAQSVKRPTLGFGSGHDLTVVGSSPMSGSVLTA